MVEARDGLQIALRGPLMYKRILVAFDGSEGSWRALRAAIDLAEEQNAELWALSVEEHLPHYAAAIGEFEEAKAEKNEYFKRLHSQANELAEARGVQLRTEVLPGHAVQTIVRFASQGAFDLIVMGHSGYSGVWGAFLGTTTDKVSRHAPCSVLIVR